jgi:phosphoglycolate phosphatase-like HAD superfamily hydrolase
VWWRIRFPFSRIEPMRLVIFDVDGTLTDTMAVDARCFLRTFVEVCGFQNVDSDWSRYEDATDAGIFREIFESRTRRSPSAAEIAQFREHLVALFRSSAQEKVFAAVPGAPELLARLKKSDEYRVALATGCWADSARVKMASAGMCYDDYPSASADDAPDRETIIKVAMERACRRADQRVSVAIYVGDGVWDARACRHVGIPFVGIGVGSQAEELSKEGAVHVFGDLTDTGKFLQVLQSLEN